MAGQHFRNVSYLCAKLNTTDNMYIKKSVCTIVCLLAAVASFAQSDAAQKRVVLIEEFTNTGCGPCATWSPMLDRAIDYRLGDCIAIKYHVNFPENRDPYYLYSADDMRYKMNYYNATSVPMTVINGTPMSERSFGAVSSAVTWCQAQPTDFTLSVERSLADHVMGVRAHVVPLSKTSNPNLRLNVAVVEMHTAVDTPFPNGETELNFTLLKLLTGGAGQPLDAELEAMKAVDYEGEWAVDFGSDESQLAVVAFVQDAATREVLAAAFELPTSDKTDQLRIMDVTDTPDLTCTPLYYGRIVLRNDGSNQLTSAMVNVEVNGVVRQYPWSGRLDYLDRDTLSFDGFDGFELAAKGRNQVKIWCADINGTQAQGEAQQLTFQTAPILKGSGLLKIYTDRHPEEITWKIFNSAGDVVQQGGPYTEARRFMTEPLQLPGDDCYVLQFEDAGGDGIRGAAGNGYYQLFQVDAAGKSTKVDQGDYTEAIHLVNFSLSDALPLAIAPAELQQLDAQARVYTLGGRLVGRVADVGRLPSGAYLLRYEPSGATRKLIVR